jgi:hypothetical protein
MSLQDLQDDVAYWKRKVPVHGYVSDADLPQALALGTETGAVVTTHFDQQRDAWSIVFKWLR